MIVTLLVEITFVIAASVGVLLFITLVLGRKSQGTTSGNEVFVAEIEVIEVGKAAKASKDASRKNRRRLDGMLDGYHQKLRNRVEQDAKSWQSRIITTLKLAHPVSPFFITIFSGFVAVLVFEWCIVSDVLIVRDDFKAEKDRCIGRYEYTQEGRSRSIAVAWGKEQVINCSSHPVVVYEILYGRDDDRPLHSFIIGQGEIKLVTQKDFHLSPKISEQMQFCDDADTNASAPSHKIYQAWWYADVRPTPEEYYETDNLHFDDSYGWKTLRLTRQAWKPHFRESEEEMAEERSEE